MEKRAERLRDVLEEEILTGVRVPRLSGEARFGYYKICRKTGEFAEAIGAVLRDPGRGIFRGVVGATEAAPPGTARPMETELDVEQAAVQPASARAARGSV